MRDNAKERVLVVREGCSTSNRSIYFNAPWQTLWPVGLLISICGLSGIVYIMIITRQARRQTDYRPVMEDWLWHTIFPLISYITLVVTGLLFPSYAYLALFGVAASTLLFLFIGIHNAWDTVTYITIQDSQRDHLSVAAREIIQE